MPEIQIYETAPTTPRGAEKLARFHGYESVSQLAESLPPGARVIDVGAGDSPLGSEVAALRSDIEWVNFDFSYGDVDAVENLQRNAPDNVRFVAGDVTKIGEMYEPGTYDAAFSYWLWPHLSLGYTEAEEPTLALEAAKSVYDLVKDGGVVSIGPANDKLRGYIKDQPAYHVTKDASMSAEQFARAAVEKTRLHGAGRLAQRTTNNAVVPYFGTSRYVQRTQDGKIHILDPDTGDFVSKRSRRGLRIMSGLAAESGRFMATDPESKAYIGGKLKKAGAVAGGLVVAATARKVLKNRR